MVRFFIFNQGEIWTQKDLIPREKHNHVGFSVGIKGFCVRVSSLPQEKQQPLKIWLNPKFTNFSEKSKIYGGK